MQNLTAAQQDLIRRLLKKAYSTADIYAHELQAAKELAEILG